jgi:hypothetical protein
MKTINTKGVMMNKEILDEKVYYYTDVIEDPKKLVAAIEGMSSSAWGEWAACSGMHYVYGATKDVLPKHMRGDVEDADYDYIYDTINNAMHAVARDYAEAMGNTDDPKLFPVHPIKKYMAGTFMGAHFDQQEGDERLKYSLVMYLNDDYEGGEISFTIRNPEGVIQGGTPAEDFEIAKQDNSFTFAVKPKAGSVIIFPPSPPYHHTAHLVKDGFKYMVPQHWIH